MVLFRWQKKMKNFRDAIPNFISFCKSSGMELVGESTNGIIFRRPLSIEKLKAAYMKRYDEELVLPDDPVLYQYVGLSCEG